MAKKCLKFDLTEGQIAILDALKVKTEATSYGEVLRQAVRVYEYIIDVGGPDAKLVIERSDGVTEIVKIFV